MGEKRMLFTPEGRIGRARYWVAAITSVFAPLIVMSLLVFAVGGLPRGSRITFGITDMLHDPLSFGFGDSFRHASTAASLFLYIVAAPVCLAAIWFFTASSIRRLHDRGRSGWWIFPFFVAPMAFNEIDTQMEFSSATLSLGIAVLALGVWGGVETLLLRGTYGPNRFGADPLAPPGRRPARDPKSGLEFVAHKAGPLPRPHVIRGHD